MLAPDSPVASPRESQGLVASQSIWEEEEEEEDSVDSWAITALPPVRQVKRYTPAFDPSHYIMYCSKRFLSHRNLANLHM